MLLASIAFLTAFLSLVLSHPAETQNRLAEAPRLHQHSLWNKNISNQLFAELEELSRIVDISYCVGLTGIYKPFKCASRCVEFPNFELVDTFNTGPLMSDSCGYVALDHGRNNSLSKNGRIIIAFRGTYSIANTIVDLSTVPQEYVPYPTDPDDSNPTKHTEKAKDLKCNNCTVHTGFWTSWQNTRPYIIGHLEYAQEKYPDYQIHLVGHSLGGAVAALAGIEFNAHGWNPIVTTFGEPRIGNSGLRKFFDDAFESQNGSQGRYRRVTHIDDPVPLLPLHEWGYRSHAGEVYISKYSLQPTVEDIQHCSGDNDMDCVAGAEAEDSWFGQKKGWGLKVPARYRMWQLFFAHRDYFWRLGLCVPGGDPFDWGRHHYAATDGDIMSDEL